MGAGFRIPRVGLAAIKAGSRAGGSGGASRDFDELLSLVPVIKIEGKKNDQEEEYADGPEEALHESVPVFLGVKENPEGHDERNHVKKDKKETHSGFSPKPPVLMAHSSWLMVEKFNGAISHEPSAISYFLRLSYHSRFFLISSGMGSW